MEDDSLCGGRTLLEGLHARFARMHIWAVTSYTSNGRMGIWVFDRWWMDFGGRMKVCVVGALYRKDYMLALLACIFGP
ncbi:hypothetical protein [Listeria monocytogenes]|uniref:hypothetical protein n=1 Tax=Listeria monocytogenes TaxID=1639 RepID=UPI001EFD2BBB|nr:hypothetical protein [Listeria monocytogenes]